MIITHLIIVFLLICIWLQTFRLYNDIVEYNENKDKIKNNIEYRNTIQNEDRR